MNFLYVFFGILIAFMAIILFMAQHDSAISNEHFIKNMPCGFAKMIMLEDKEKYFKSSLYDLAVEKVNSSECEGKK